MRTAKSELFAPYSDNSLLPFRPVIICKPTVQLNCRMFAARHVKVILELRPPSLQPWMLQVALVYKVTAVKVINRMQELQLLRTDGMHL